MEDKMKDLATKFKDYAEGDNHHEVVEKCILARCCYTKCLNAHTTTECTNPTHRQTFVRKGERGCLEVLKPSEYVCICPACDVAFVIHDPNLEMPAVGHASLDFARGKTKKKMVYFPFLCTICMRSFIGHLAQEAVNEALSDVENGKSHREEQEKSKKRKK